MISLAAVLAVLSFIVAFRASGLVAAARGAVTVAAQAGAVMRAPDLDDAAKEAAVQKAALSMVRASVSIFLRVALTLAGTMLPVLFLDLVGLVETAQVLAFLARPSVIVGATLIVGLGAWLWSRRRKTESAYAPMDRFLHRLAFAAPVVQRVLAETEDSALAGAIRDIPDSPPVFITSLPRAGTTVVLNAMHDVPGVATHLYRDMPFVMAPLLWSRLSGGFRKQSTLAERAHGDGIAVGYDSPEAFEEVLWRQFWPDHYKGDAIRPWTAADADAEARAFMQRHFRKIIALRTKAEHRASGRYVSKNNGNIARLDLLPGLFPGAAIIVPLRDPAEHAASLWRQHMNFLDQHGRDDFVRRYMNDIGHLEFGALHKPIDFAGFAAAARGLGPSAPDYWLAYWLAAFEMVAERAEGVILAPETALQAEPQRMMQRLCARAGIDPGDTDFTRHFRPIGRSADRGSFDPARLRTAEKLHARLAATAQKQLF